jgi:DNA/RNA-binding domain of Phe-tRNA-synthetase-like protein
LSAEAERMWFILDSLPAMPLAALHEAGDELIAGLRQMMPGVTVEQRLIGRAS